MTESARTLKYISSSEKDLGKLPQDVQEVFLHGLALALIGEQHPDAEPMKGFGDACVLEIRERHKGDAFRAVYTVRFEKAVYVLHVFKKKSKKGIETPKPDMELIKLRLKAAEVHYKANFKSKKKNEK